MEVSGPGRMDWRLPAVVLVVLLVIGFSFPGLRATLLGRTHQVDATVVDVRTDEGCTRSDRTLHDVAWRDEDGEHTALLKTCGPVRYEVGERVRVWVAPGVDDARRDSPRSLWLGVVVVPTVVVALGAWLIPWFRGVRRSAGWARDHRHRGDRPRGDRAG
jgi:hypothetical protein